MKQVDLRHFEYKLMEWRATLEHQLRPIAETPSDPDPVTRQSEEMAESLESLWREAVILQTRDIDCAVQKIREGSFGRCEQCGKPISPRRLKAVPWARKCLSCQSALPEQRPSVAYKTATYRWYSPS
jgi:RNA polymerase-binding protein DksA